MAEVFTRSEVLSLNAYQSSGYCHPYTCPNEHRWPSGKLSHGHRNLHATPEGWVCPWATCDYEQDWAHDSMKDWSWLEMRQPWHPEIKKPDEEV